MFFSFIEHRSLIMALIKRDIDGKYRGSILGVLWSFIQPVLMLAVYTFVFSIVFNARWGKDPSESRTEFAVILFIGIIIHSLFAECINRAPTLIVGNVNYVKKVVFPLEILAWIPLGSALFHVSIALLVWVVFTLASGLTLQPTAILLPLILLPLMIFTMGLSWFLASLGVYLRDIGQVTGVVTTIMLFLAPVFYPLAGIPIQYQEFIQLNPLTFIIEQARSILIWGHGIYWIGLLKYTIASCLVYVAGFFWFQRTRKGFADVL